MLKLLILIFIRYVRPSVILRLVTGQWIVALIVLNIELRTQLVTWLTSPSITHPPQTFKQLANSHYTISFSGINDTTAGKIFQSLSDNHLVQVLKEKIVNYSRLADMVNFKIF